MHTKNPNANIIKNFKNPLFTFTKPVIYIIETTNTTDTVPNTAVNTTPPIAASNNNDNVPIKIPSNKHYNVPQINDVLGDDIASNAQINVNIPLIANVVTRALGLENNI